VASRYLSVPMTLSDLWPQFQGHNIFRSWISPKQFILGTKLVVTLNTNRKPYPVYRMAALSMTLSDLWPGFQDHNIFWSRILEKQDVLKTKLLFHTNRKLYLTYGMVTMFGDLDSVDWPLNISCGFVSISWASCWVILFTDKQPYTLREQCSLVMQQHRHVIWYGLVRSL